MSSGSSSAPARGEWRFPGSAARWSGRPANRCPSRRSRRSAAPACRRRHRAPVNVIESSRGVLAPPIRVARQHDSLCALSSVVTMNGPADGPGPLSWACVERLGCRRHARGSSIAGEHAAPLRERLGERHHGLPVVDAAGHRRDAVEAGGGGDLVRRVFAAMRVGLRRDVFPRDRRAVGPDRLRVDGVGDDLWIASWSVRRSVK